ncbi:hypothetical protein EBR57_01315 [bacterium]|nr:hypothetical protein [bacterium]
MRRYRKSIVLKPLRRLIGLIGTNGAGKSVVCDYLRQQGFLVASLSDIVRAEVRHRNKPETRDVLVQTSNDLKIQFGMDVLARRSFHESSEKDVSSIAFDSIRNLAEVQYLHEKGVVFLGVDAPIALRYDRIVQRGRASDAIDFVTFQAHDDRENKGQSAGQNIFQALEACKTIIQNTGDIDALHTHVDAFLTHHFGRVGNPV